MPTRTRLLAVIVALTALVAVERAAAASPKFCVHPVRPAAFEACQSAREAMATAQKTQADDAWYWRLLDSSLLTAIVAGLTLGFTAAQAIRSRADSQRKDRLQRADALFADAVRQSASSSPAERIAGAVLLEAFCLERDDDYARRAWLLLQEAVSEAQDDDRRPARTIRATASRVVAKAQPWLVLKDAFAADLTLDGVELVGRDLRGINLARASLRGAKLQGANLNRADLQEADLTDAWLTDAALGGANLGNAKLTGAHLARADLRGSLFNRASVEGLSQAQWSEARLSNRVRGRLETE